MKKVLVIFLAVTLSFAGISSISASNNLLKTQTKDRVIFVKDQNGSFVYSWAFNKEEYEKNEFDFDLEINFKSKNKAKIESLVKDDFEAKYVSFNYHGNLPAEASIKIPVDDMFEDGERLKLYYYDEEKDEIELVSSSVKVINGYANFNIDHCSDYFLTLSIVKEAEGESNNGVIIVGMIIVIVGLIGYTLIKNQK
jgi:hypothetical protein